MTGDDEVGEEDGPSWMDRVKERVPEAGVGFFGTFLLAMAIGFLLATSGQLALAMIVFLVAIVSVLAMLLTPSPTAKARRAARDAPSDEGEDGEEGGEEKGEADDTTRPDLRMDDQAAPTSRRRDVPAPPPEPPPLEDIVVETGDEEGPLTQEKAPPGEDEDVWVE